jgi:hypothetical protein
MSFVPASYDLSIARLILPVDSRYQSRHRFIYPHTRELLNSDKGLGSGNRSVAICPLAAP